MSVKILVLMRRAFSFSSDVTFIFIFRCRQQLGEECSGLLSLLINTSKIIKEKALSC